MREDIILRATLYTLMAGTDRAFSSLRLTEICYLVNSGLVWTDAPAITEG